MRNSWKFPTAAVLATAVLIAAGPRPARSQAVELVVADVATVAKGYRTSKLMGSSVVNDRDERIGTIDASSSAATAFSSRCSRWAAFSAWAATWWLSRIKASFWTTRATRSCCRGRLRTSSRN